MPPEKKQEDVVRSVRFKKSEWTRVSAKAHDLGLPAGRLIHMATMYFMGDRTELDQMRAVADALEGTGTKR